MGERVFGSLAFVSTMVQTTLFGLDERRPMYDRVAPHGDQIARDLDSSGMATVQPVARRRRRWFDGARARGG